MRRVHRGGLILSAVVLALVLVAVPVNRYRSRKPPELTNLTRLDRLLSGCRLFAVDHAGRYPTHLDALSPEYLFAEVLEESRYEVIQKQRGAGFRLDWLYFGNGFDDAHPPRVLIAAPQVIENASQQMRIYLAGDGKSHVAKEEDYQKELTETVRQLQEMVKLHPTPPSAPTAPVGGPDRKP